MKKNLTIKILETIALAGAFVVVSQSPYFWGALIKSYLKNFHKNNQQIKQCLFNLKRRGDILIQHSKDGLVKIELTARGKKKLLNFQFWDLKIKKPPKKWDKKWRLIIFDIPKEKDKIRDLFRLKLREFGFYQLQKSIWLYPYDCQSEISLIRKYLRIEPCVRFVVTKELEAEGEVLDYFKLRFKKKVKF